MYLFFLDFSCHFTISFTFSLHSLQSSTSCRIHVEFLVSVYLPIYTLHFPFISRCTSRYTSPASRFAFSHRFHPPSFLVGAQPLYPWRYVSLSVAAVQRCIPSTAFRSRLPRTNASFDSCDSTEELPQSHRKSTLLALLAGNILLSRFLTDRTYRRALIILDSLTACCRTVTIDVQLARKFVRGEHMFVDSLFL